MPDTHPERLSKPAVQSDPVPRAVPEFFARSSLLAALNAIEDAYAADDNAAAVFAIMQAKADLGLSVSR